MPKVKLYIPEALKSEELAFCFKPARVGVFNEEFPPNFFETRVEQVEPERALAIVLPNNFKKSDPEAGAYIKKYADVGECLGIPVCLFSLGDFTDHLRFDSRVMVITSSVYRSQMPPNAVVMPALTEDNAKGGIVLRAKSGTPQVSFCGMGGFSSWKGWAKYYVKNFLYDFEGIAKPALRARKIGVYWRIKMMQACAASTLVTTHFIVRKTFSGNRKTIELDPAVARKEYLESISNSDFVLAPKGDGNYSNRFIKTLCMGRIPVVVDTDIVLPFEDIIDYSKISVRVPMQKVGDTPRLVRAFYDALTEGEWQARQQLARETFEKYLRIDSFFATFFSRL